MFRSSASLASFEDSNTENEPEPGRARAASVSVSRRARVTRATKSVLADVDAEQDKNRQVTCHVLSPVTLAMLVFQVSLSEEDGGYQVRDQRTEGEAAQPGA